MLDHGNVTGSFPSPRHDLDIWHVRLANGETRSLSLDELDAGFQAGWIGEATLVLRAGALRWAPLSEVAGLDATPAPVEVMPNSIAPLALALDSFDAHPNDEEVNAFRPRRGRKVLGVMTALIVVAGLGYAGLRARPSLQRALASRSTQPAPVQPAPVQPAPPAPAPAPAPVPVPPPAVATMAASALPNAPALAPVAKTKPGRPSVKRAGGAPRP